MKITVLGLWHRGCIIAASIARHHQVIGLDFDQDLVSDFTYGKVPVNEPGLDDLLAEHFETRRLQLSSNAMLACLDADALWIALDTPLDESGAPNTAPVLAHIQHVLPHLAPGTLVLVSSLLTASACAALQLQFPQFHFAFAPLDLPVGRALETFEQAERVIVGIRDDAKREVIDRLFDPFTERTIFLPLSSHALAQHARDLCAHALARESSGPAASEDRGTSAAA